MAGPGIRYHQIATELAKHFNVTLATFNPDYIKDLGDTDYRAKDINANDFQDDFKGYDIIFALWLSPAMIDFAKKHGIKIIFDLYAPVPVEELIGRFHAHRTDQASDYDYVFSLQNYHRFFLKGDYFVCSNPIQKDFWTGFAFAANADLPSTHREFSIYDRIGLLPMGINLSEIKQNRLAPDLLRKEFPSIKKDDFVLVWTGGIWDWFDALSPIQAIKHLVDSGEKNVKLVFLGTRHPNSEVPEMQETVSAYDTAEKLGLKDSYVFFREGWIDYNSRLSYLLHANAAIYAHKPSVEARYSHRTRVLDHFLCSLPTIATEGDFLGDLAAESGMGLTVPPLNSKAIANTIKKLKDDTNLQNTIQHTITSRQTEFTWAEMTKDLVAFISSDTPTRKPAIIPKIVSNSSHGRRLKKLIPKSVKRQLKKRLVR